MKFTVISLMPELVSSAFQSGLVGQAIKRGDIVLETKNPRAFGERTHRTVDDRVFGGGDGMLMQAEPLAKCLDEVLQLHQSLRNEPSRLRVIHLSPRGQILTDSLAREIAIANQEVVLISTRYAGVDERLLQEYAIEEISIGDYILSGGEIPACVLIEAVARHIPGVLGNTVSSQVDSFHDGLLEGPQYTRPRSWRNRVVPDILLCGDQALIKDFHRLLSIKVTAERRFDLIQRFGHELVLLEVDGVIKRAEVVLREAGVASNRRQAGEEIQAIGNEVRQLLLGRLGDKK